MHTYRIEKRRNPVLWAVSLLVIAGLACSLGGGPAATDTPAAQPTQAPATEAVVAAPPQALRRSHLRGLSDGAVS